MLLNFFLKNLSVTATHLQSKLSLATVRMYVCMYVNKYVNK